MTFSITVVRTQGHDCSPVYVLLQGQRPGPQVRFLKGVTLVFFLHLSSWNIFKMYMQNTMGYGKALLSGKAGFRSLWLWRSWITDCVFVLVHIGVHDSTQPQFGLDNDNS